MMRPTLLVASILLAGVCLSASSSVHAQPAPQAPAKPSASHKPTQKDIEEARKRFRKAEAAKARGEYQTAAVEYLAAYELFQEPAFFYDTAEVYRLAGDEKNALVYYTKYLELAPSGKGAPAARLAAEQLRRSIAAQEDAARRAADEESRRKAEQVARAKADEDARAKAADDARTKAVAAADRRADVEPAGRAGRTMRIAGLAAGGAGVVALGVGVMFGLKARSLSDEATGWDAYNRNRDDQGKAAQRNMVVFTGVGAAALVAGGVLYYLGHRAEHAAQTSSVSIAPSVGPSQIAVMAAGRF